MQTSLKLLRIVAVLEGISTLVLFFISMPLKYFFDSPGSVRPVGMAHGILFIGYVGLVFLVALGSKWKKADLLWSLIASIFPFGTFVADHKIFKPLSKRYEHQV